MEGFLKGVLIAAVGGLLTAVVWQIIFAPFLGESSVLGPQTFPTPVQQSEKVSVVGNPTSSASSPSDERCQKLRAEFPQTVEAASARFGISPNRITLKRELPCDAYNVLILGKGDVVTLKVPEGAYSAESFRSFHAIGSTQSTRWRPPIPLHCGQSFHTIASTCSSRVSPIGA